MRGDEGEGGRIWKVVRTFRKILDTSLNSESLLRD